MEEHKYYFIHYSHFYIEIDCSTPKTKQKRPVWHKNEGKHTIAYSAHLQRIDTVSKREIGNFQSIAQAIFLQICII